MNWIHSRLIGKLCYPHLTCRWYPFWEDSSPSGWQQLVFLRLAGGRQTPATHPDPDPSAGIKNCLFVLLSFWHLPSCSGGRCPWSGRGDTPRSPWGRGSPSRAWPPRWRHPGCSGRSSGPQSEGSESNKSDKSSNPVLCRLTRMAKNIVFSELRETSRLSLLQQLLRLSKY